MNDLNPGFFVTQTFERITDRLDASMYIGLKNNIEVFYLTGAGLCGNGSKAYTPGG